MSIESYLPYSRAVPASGMVISVTIDALYLTDATSYCRFGPLPITEVERRLQTVIEQEKVQLTPDGMKALLRLSRGDMRRALNVLQVGHLRSTPLPMVLQADVIIL